MRISESLSLQTEILRDRAYSRFAMANDLLRAYTNTLDLLLNRSGFRHESSRIFRTDVRYTSIRLSSGIAKGSQPFAWGVGLCPTSLPSRAASGGARKKGKKEFFGGTPNPVRGLSPLDRKSTRLNSSHTVISYAVFC